MGGSGARKNKFTRKDEDNTIMVDDPRFAAMANRPQFRKPKKKLPVETPASAPEEDSRFAALKTDSRYKLHDDGSDDDDDPASNRYGRRKTKKKSKKHVAVTSPISDDEKDDDSSSSQEEDEGIEKMKSAASVKKDDTDNLPNDPASRIAYLTALSRGQISGSSSDDDSSSGDEDDSSSSDESDVDEDVVGASGILDPENSDKKSVEITYEPSTYLAVLNMDWGNVRAVDILAIVSSFSPPGSVKSVQVYPSDFGMERMKHEATHGPPLGLWSKDEQTKGDDDDDDDDDMNSDSSDKDDSHDSDSDSDQEGSEDEEEEEPSELDLYKQFAKQANEFNDTEVATDMNMEQLRAYEASKLKYYFAVVEFVSSEAVDVAYRELDGIELEHSSAALDVRSIPPSEITNVRKDRTIRDEAHDVVPSHYTPKHVSDSVVGALQNTNVRCTWEEGDSERDRVLTKYSTPGALGGEDEENDDALRAYLASDASSDEESDAEDNDDSKKGTNMRKMLGLEGSDEEDSSDGESSDQATPMQSDDDDDDDENGVVKQATFIPGKQGLEDKIRSKLQAKNEPEKVEAELTPWEKYQLKKKEKKREKRKAARDTKKDGKKNDMYKPDPGWGAPDADEDETETDGDFFVEDAGEKGINKKGKSKGKKEAANKTDQDGLDRKPSTKEELELLLAGDNDEEEARDYDMRGLMRMAKNDGKKLRGSRKRREAEKASAVSGTDFTIDTKDDRFAAVLSGTDDRFGIDPTDPQFKETPAMKQVLAEQSRQRRKKKRARSEQTPDVQANADADPSIPSSGGAMALSSLVQSLKKKVTKK